MEKVSSKDLLLTSVVAALAFYAGWLAMSYLMETNKAAKETRDYVERLEKDFLDFNAKPSPRDVPSVS